MYFAVDTPWGLNTGKYHMPGDLEPFLPLVFLYAETHFRFFRWFPSLLFRRVPEVVFDMPRRLAPGEDLPVILILNDIDRYPVETKEVAITVSHKGSPIESFRFAELEQHALPHPLSHQSSILAFTIPRKSLHTGEIHLNASATLGRGAKEWRVLNDNLPTASHQGFTVRVADTPLPGRETCTFGDMHVHSQLSQSHVEFGPPIAAIRQAAKAYGLDFWCVTDHSYDLACRLENYLERDSAIQRWEALRAEVARQPSARPFTVLGEEVSCHNKSGQVVHLCTYGSDEFLPGSQDGARRFRRSEPQLTIGQCISSVHAHSGLAVAAHPGWKTGLLQRTLLKRGRWGEKDVSKELDGMQVLNSGFSRSWARGKALWISKLQQGLRIPLIAGNDSHGDFNRYRCIGTPFLSVVEGFDRCFGDSRTGVYGRASSQSRLLELIRQGRTFVTDGPMLCLARSREPKECIVEKEDTPLSSLDAIYVIAQSTPEFGSLSRLKVFQYTYGREAETTIFTKSYGPGSYECCEEIAITDINPDCYIRAEVTGVLPSGVTKAAATSGCFLVK